MPTFPWILSAHRVFTGVLFVQVVITLLISFYTGEWLIPVALSLFIAGLPLALILLAPANPLTRHTVAAATQLLTALHIDQTMGLVELHFEIFAVLAVLVYYRDWKVIVTSVLVVAVHHVLFFFLQLNDAGVYIFAADYVNFGILTIHASFAVAEGAILAFIAHRTFIEAQTALRINSAIEDIVGNDKGINLAVSLDADNEQIQRFNQLIEAMRTSVAETELLVDSVEQQSEELAGNTQALTSRRQQSATELSRIVHGIEQMVGTVNAISDESQRAREAANTALSDTSNAADYTVQVNGAILSVKETVAEALEHIKSLEQKSSRISTVVAAINDITKQTNLLALNAAIEAARAGEQGRGFAVVADEVRSLASTTERNAAEISDISQQIIDEVTQSVTIVEQATQVIDDGSKMSVELKQMIESVATKVRTMAETIEQVAFATEQQSNATADMSSSAKDLKAVSEQEYEFVKNNDEKTRQLAEDAERLRHQIEKFAV
ncbi:hypothetical protein C5610_07700 [Idiomarina sp. OT37-5b]|uniref:Methyl-accepting transducer domain-containing protein n=1 Tax=Idiomarina aquatica TaxID=1327752 RepID=A0AA94EE45_9GAMM|nr:MULTISPECIES: methyl-accepting chemotaxis protein [Idiomarina]AVJ56207.1 hypothetical protein C5610_07700 [Idiomarina sp. OT37-5b]RUO43275.1 hypothetical protein CWE23_07945 [Idiomarina aquatica]